MLAWMAGPNKHVAVSDGKAGIVLKDAVLARMLGRPHLGAAQSIWPHDPAVRSQKCNHPVAVESTYLHLRLGAASSHGVLKSSPHLLLCHMQFRVCCLHAVR